MEASPLDRNVREELEVVKAALRDWDPIGVHPNCPEGPEDEYDSYAPRALGLLRGGAVEEELVAYLREIRTARMGLPRYDAGDQAIATTLLHWWTTAKRFEAHGLTLLIPDKPDPERDAVDRAWRSAGGDVLRIGRFWDPPNLDLQSVRVYGSDSFCLVLQQKLGLNLVSPADEEILAVPQKHLLRQVTRKTIGDLMSTDFPVFVKPATPKAFRARVYADMADLEAECIGLSEDTVVIRSEPVSIIAEARAFVLDGVVLDCSLYEGEADVHRAERAVQLLLRDVRVPRAVVVDVGLIPDRGWCLVEFNAAWGAGLNGCHASRVLPAIEAASAPLAPVR